MRRFTVYSCYNIGVIDFFGPLNLQPNAKHGILHYQILTQALRGP